MFRLHALIAIFCLYPAIVVAQGDGGEEQQRCVWSCLYNSPGADSTEYRACVRQYCENIGAVDAAPLAAPQDGLASSVRPQARPDAAPPPDPAAPSLPTFAAPAAAWTFGATSDGRGMFAGIADADRGSRIDWLCAKGMSSLLAITPYAGDGHVTITVAGRAQVFAARAEGQGAYLPVALDAPLFIHLASGSEVEVAHGDGTVIGRFPMTGAALAIGQAEGRCR